MTPYDQLKRRLAAGWNTWNTRSVLSHVLLPEGFAVNLAVKEYRNGGYLKEALIGRQGDDEERIHPRPRTIDGTYTALTLTWRDIELDIQSATDSGDLVLLVTPVRSQVHPPTLAVEAGLLWNRPGLVERRGNVLSAALRRRSVDVFATRRPAEDPYIAAQSPYLPLPLDGPVGISTGRPRALEEIRGVLADRRAELDALDATRGAHAEAASALRTCMAWDTIYDPLKDRVVTPVSRIWNVASGGYILFCWDTYFGAYLAAPDSKDLAYSNAIEITREMTEDGFVPNFASANGNVSRDRSQPPVGGLVVRELYRIFRERWLPELLFDDLVRWNRWWDAHRQSGGLLCWGSNPFSPRLGNHWETAGVNDTFGGALESGLDNSPMYDDVPFDMARHVMRLQDVGLSGLYTADCEALADLARALGRTDEAAELDARRARYAENLKSLWDEKTGLFLNRRTDTGALSPRISPTHFYALLARAATPAQAERMVGEHLLSPDEFWGDWVIPSIARSDPAYADQTYWRGRIWAPMNFLVYLALLRYDLPDARAALARKSEALLLKEWREHGHVHENYCADTGQGCNKPNSDRFYHWGALLALIPQIEAGILPDPSQPLSAA